MNRQKTTKQDAGVKSKHYIAAAEMGGLIALPPYLVFMKTTSLRVRKISGKPFKSGLKVNTVAEVRINDNTKRPAYSVLT